MTTHPSTIGEQAQAVLSQSAESLPTDMVRAFAGDRDTTAARGIPEHVLTTGSAMPDGRLLDVNGVATSLTVLRRGRPAVVVFYRGGWCPYCNIALRTYQAGLLPALIERGIELIAISPQKPDGSLSAAESNRLDFVVASDPGNEIAAALGILTRPSPDALAGQRKLGLDLADVNADGGTTLPMPTVMVVDAVGAIRWIDVHPDYTTRSEVADILSALDALPVSDTQK